MGRRRASLCIPISKNEPCALNKKPQLNCFLLPYPKINLENYLKLRVCLIPLGLTVVLIALSCVFHALLLRFLFGGCAGDMFCNHYASRLVLFATVSFDYRPFSKMPFSWPSVRPGLFLSRLDIVVVAKGPNWVLRATYVDPSSVLRFPCTAFHA